MGIDKRNLAHESPACVCTHAILSVKAPGSHVLHRCPVPNRCAPSTSTLTIQDFPITLILGTDYREATRLEVMELRVDKGIDMG